MTMSSKDKAKKTAPKLVSDLPYPTLKRLADRLDVPCGGNQLYWRRMVDVWAGSPYDQLTIERFAMNAHRVDGSPAYALLTDMSNRGVAYSHLVSLLKKINHNSALHELGYREEVRFLQHPQAAPAVLGQQLVLEAEATGVPQPEYLWFKERTPLPDQTARTLLIEHVTKEHEGTYVCRATNEVNVAFSNWAEVKVQKPSILRSQLIPDPQELPEIITQPLPEIIFQPGQELRLVVVARGVGQLLYQWFRDSQRLPFGASHELHLPTAQVSDQGIYTCRVSSELGGSVLSNPCTVVVSDPAAATSQPAPLHHRVYPPGPEQFSPQPPLPPHQPPPPPHQPANGWSFQEMYQQSPVDGGHPLDPYYPPYAESPYPLPTPSPAVPTAHTGPIKRTVSPPTSQSGLQPIPDDGPRGQDERADLSKPCYDKVALLIGNRNYHVGKLVLNTPENDTQDLAGVLRSAGFKVVSLVNLSKWEMDQAVNFFISLLGKNVYALFFFAGHGFELHNMNYMMPVDAAAEKNPGDCLCAQKVLDYMQGSGAKLSIVLLDMCRVQAPTPIQQDGIYEPQSRDYNGYFVYGFSCSPSGRAFEHAPKSSTDLPTEERENSIFVSALKEHFQKGTLSERIDVLLTQAANGVRRRGDKCFPSTASWQKPEIRHNLGEALSLSDTITESVEGSVHRETRSQLWQNAHYVPDATVVASPRGELALRLHFEAEHSNVLVVTAELLNGCLGHTEVLTMSMELLPDQHALIRLQSTEQYDSEHTKFFYGHQQKQRKRDLIHFKIPEIQKVQASAVTLLVTASYRHQQHGEEHMASTKIYHHLPPPLYAKVLADPTFQPFMVHYTP